MSDVLVSVLCTAYNHEKYIRSALEGFVSQKTSFRFEVIVHDDASTDGTADIIRKYEEKYPEIIKPIYQTENQFSKGVKISNTYMYPKVQGEFIAFCEGDDYWIDENKLQMQVDFLRKHSEYSACVHNTIRRNCRTQIETPYNQCDIDKDLQIDDILCGGSLPFHISSLMMRKDLYIMPDAFYTKNFGDYPRAIYLLMSGKVRYFSKFMSVYRFFADGSWSVRKEAGGIERDIEHHQEVINLLTKIDQYTGYKYHNKIIVSVDNNQVAILEDTYNYREILGNGRYIRIYLCIGKGVKKRLKRALILMLGAIMPRVIKNYFLRKERAKKNEK